MDELIAAFFKQCETGRVQIGEFFYNIHFRINYYLDDNVLDESYFNSLEHQKIINKIKNQDIPD